MEIFIWKAILATEGTRMKQRFFQDEEGKTKPQRDEWLKRSSSADNFHRDARLAAVAGVAVEKPTVSISLSANCWPGEDF
jgi:hypothetical protein